MGTGRPPRGSRERVQERRVERRRPFARQLQSRQERMGLGRYIHLSLSSDNVRTATQTSSKPLQLLDRQISNASPS